MIQRCLIDVMFDEPKELDQSLLGLMNRHLNKKTLTLEDMPQSWEWPQPLVANLSPLESLDDLITFEPELFSSPPDPIVCLPSALEPTPIKPGLFLRQEDQMKGLMVNSKQDCDAVWSTGTYLQSASSRTFDDDCSKKRKDVPSIRSSRPNKRPHTANNKTMGKSPNFRPYQHHQFQKRYEALLRFKARHGHCLVPHEYDEDPALARWVKRQRYQYKMKAAGKSESTMTEERISMLEAVGFVWDSHELAWEGHMEELRLYKQEHGDCNVPATYTKNPALGAWVKCVRRQYRRLFNGESYNITFERIAALDALGFDWKKRNVFL